ncbi:unnamed protein product [Heligmosomoides polygyrus]|uniref:Reverse transcriptase domain-containing protein n=1 Tax=Heligmosomoides polygyrus TaxID=6339 RepID=A0A183FN85_HELPZ|nr:unnamed protein product [Heligmosomoides polygyrus]
MDAITRDLQNPVPSTLLYADDVMVAFDDKDDLERQVQAWCNRLAMFGGLSLNLKKTEYLSTDVNESGSNKIDGTELACTSVFKYLGSTIASDGGVMVEVNSRVSAAWYKWRSLTGVLCERKIPEHLKSKIYRAVVRPVAITALTVGLPLRKLKRASASWRRRCCAGRLESRAWTTSETMSFGTSSVPRR